MRKILIALMGFMMMALMGARAQSSSPLLGKWKTLYEIEGQKMYVEYEFRKEQGKLLCYTNFISDDKGEGEAYTSLAMSAITFQNGKGESLYILDYEGETYKVDASLTLLNANTLEVDYFYYGFGDTEIWKRIE